MYTQQGINFFFHFQRRERFNLCLFVASPVQPKDTRCVLYTALSWLYGWEPHKRGSFSPEAIRQLISNIYIYPIYIHIFNIQYSISRYIPYLYIFNIQIYSISRYIQYPDISNIQIYTTSNIQLYPISKYIQYLDRNKYIQIHPMSKYTSIFNRNPRQDQKIKSVLSFIFF